MSTDGSLSIMLIDDEGPYRRVLQKEFERRGHEVHSCDSALGGLDRIGQEVPDVILLDLKMAEMSGIEFLKEMRSRGCDSEVVILTGYPSFETAVEALRQGAYDYLSKPVDLRSLERVVHRAGEHRALRRENRALRRALTPNTKTELSSRSPVMQNLLQCLARIAESDATVLLIGETGTGKEVVARELHRLSRRSSEPLVVIDCAALQGSVRGSELFGHERGAFTGADQARPGLFEAGHRGTVFLDEIAELDAESQAALLRALENSEIRRIGATRSRKIDVRVLAATNRNLTEEVKAGRFREDLLFRLQVLQLDLPPVRDRLEDLEPLFDSFLKVHFRGHVIPQLGADARKVFLNYHWPGNVREVRNVAEMLAATVDGPSFDVSDLPRRMTHQGETTVSTAEILPLRELERKHILKVYEYSKRNKRRAAKLLGISLRTLYNKLSEYDEHAVQNDQVSA